MRDLVIQRMLVMFEFYGNEGLRWDPIRRYLYKETQHKDPATRAGRKIWHRMDLTNQIALRGMFAQMSDVALVDLFEHVCARYVLQM